MTLTPEEEAAAQKASDAAIKESAATARVRLAEQAMAPFEAAYKDLLDAWSKVETKAQGATAVVGVFLAATISVMTRSGVTLSELQKWLLMAIAAMLSLAAIVALGALAPRTVPTVIDPAERLRKVKDLLNLQDSELIAQLPIFYTGESVQWLTLLAGVKKAVDSKANWLLGAHIITAIAIVAAAFLVGTMLF